MFESLDPMKFIFQSEFLIAFVVTIFVVLSAAALFAKLVWNLLSRGTDRQEIFLSITFWMSGTALLISGVSLRTFAHREVCFTLSNCSPIIGYEHSSTLSIVANVACAVGLGCIAYALLQNTTLANIFSRGMTQP